MGDLHFTGRSQRPPNRRLGLCALLAGQFPGVVVTAKRVPAPPSRLGATGVDAWRRLHRHFTFEDHERPAVVLACSALDDVGRLEAVLDDDGLLAVGSAGQVVLHGAVAELRQARLAASRLLAALSLPVEGTAVGTPATQRARKAAQTRWSKVEQRREARGASAS